MTMKVAISPSASKSAGCTGVNSCHIMEAIQSPDNVHKIRASESEQGNWPIISLYLKRHVENDEESFLLVQGLKHKDTVTASAAWRIYPSDVNIDHAENALDVLMAFLDKYGVQLKTRQGLTKLLTYQVIASKTAVKQGRWQEEFDLPEGVLNDEDRRVRQTPEICLQKWSKQLSVKMYVAICYSINLSNYLHDLAAHDMQ
jgi:hypothetical protein